MTQENRQKFVKNFLKGGFFAALIVVLSHTVVYLCSTVIPTVPFLSYFAIFTLLVEITFLLPATFYGPIYFYMFTDVISTVIPLFQVFFTYGMLWAVIQHFKHNSTTKNRKNIMSFAPLLIFLLMCAATIVFFISYPAD